LGLQTIYVVHVGLEIYNCDRTQAINTDFFKMNDTSSGIMGLKLKLQEFDYTIVYTKGKENGNSDGLSRMFSETEPEGATVNALTGEAVGVGVTPDSEESGNT
jgi:hypothetical protein